MKHIKKTYTKFNGDYVLENIENSLTQSDIIVDMMTNNPNYTTFKWGIVITVKSGDKMIKNIFLT